MTTHYLKTLLCGFAFLTAGSLAAQDFPSFKFDTSADFDAFTVTDDNHDGQTWQYDDYDYAAFCSRDSRADDWLISPVVTLEAGRSYKIAVRAKGYSRDVAETFRLTLGGDVDPVTHTKELLATSVETDAFKEYFALFSVETSGDYYLGVHYNTSATSCAGSLSISELTLSDGAAVSVPAAPTDFTVTPGAKGELSAHISLKAPTTDASGDALTGISRLDILRGSNVIVSFDNPAPGATLEYDDKVSARATYTYRALAYNASGEGQAVQQSVFIGKDKPAAPANITARLKDGVVTISWEAPTVGLNGGYVDPEGITYTVTRRDKTVVVRDTEALSVTDTPTMPEKQAVLFYYVTAKNNEGSSNEGTSNRLAIGTPDTLPYAESFKGGRASHFWTEEHDFMSRWSCFAPGNEWTQDKDNGFAAYTPIEAGEWSRYASGLISLEGAENPVLTFYYYTPYASADLFAIEASADGEPFSSIDVIDLTDEGKTNRWNYYEVPLKEFASAKDLRIAFASRSTTTVSCLYVDNINIYDRHDYDLTPRLTSLPRDLKVGEERTFTALVTNLGAKAVEAADFSVSLLCDGREMARTKGKAIEPVGANKSFTLTVSADIDLPAETEVTARVNFEADEVNDNDISESEKVTVKPNYFPVPNNVMLDGTTLTWQQPDEPRTEDGVVTDGFEDAPDFSITNFCDWTLYTSRSGRTYVAALADGTAPSYANAGSPQAYIVFNCEAAGYPTKYSDGTPGIWTAHEGDKHMISFSSIGVNDSWLISPQLSGSEQTISFWINTPTTRYGLEHFEVLYSKTDPTADSFRPVDEEDEVAPDTWTLKSYELPQGARYFAIRKITENGFAIAIDDVTFCPDSLAARDLNLRGYNVYAEAADGTRTRLNDALLETTQFDNVPAGAVALLVTAVYDKGESAYAVVSTGEGTGINRPTVLPAYDASRPAYDLQGRRVLQPAHGIYLQGGRKVLVK